MVPGQAEFCLTDLDEACGYGSQHLEYLSAGWYENHQLTENHLPYVLGLDKNFAVARPRAYALHQNEVTL
jgi:hypothetical protein